MIPLKRGAKIIKIIEAESIVTVFRVLREEWVEGTYQCV